MSPRQGIMRKDINEKANKQDKNISPTTLTAQNDNNQYRDIHATNNKYCAPINTSHPHSFIQQTRQLIYFFSCGHTKTITLNNILLYSHNNQSEPSHRQRHTQTCFH